MTAAQEARHPRQRLGMLLAWHGAATQTRMRKALDTTGLTPRHAMTLMQLEDGPIGQRVLAERLEVDPSVLVGILNDLERDGLVERRRDPADRRRHNVAITEAGAAGLGRTNAALDAVESGLFSGLSQEERNLLAGLLARIDTQPDEFDCQEG
ncbi:MarR family winged helix-turn-helix transcriptional regulator [Streptomyces sp. NPDC087917]|uniref:MarR family winged helix-turn-helix transcriptional regulator n=1 Tax=unclassified Streptomyces TaxID=2593676 RepID=UPI00341963DF